jgi:recombination protein RecA
MMGDFQIGAQARLMSQALRKITPALSGTRTTVIFINQLREKVGIVFGNPEVTSGGKALKFYASVRLDIRRRAAIKDGTETIGHTVKIKVVKNKLAPPFRECECDIIYGLGISREAEVVKFGVDYGLIRKSGVWHYFPDELGSAQGKDKARDWLQEHSVVTNELERRIKELMQAAPLIHSGAVSVELSDPVSLLGSGPMSDLIPATGEEK